MKFLILEEPELQALREEKEEDLTMTLIKPETDHTQSTETDFSEVKNEAFEIDDSNLWAKKEVLTCGPQGICSRVPVESEPGDSSLEDWDGCGGVMKKDIDKSESGNELENPPFVTVKEEPDDEVELDQGTFELSGSTQVTSENRQGTSDALSQNNTDSKTHFDKGIDYSPISLKPMCTTSQAEQEVARLKMMLLEAESEAAEQRKIAEENAKLVEELRPKAECNVKILSRFECRLDNIEKWMKRMHDRLEMSPLYSPARTSSRLSSSRASEDLSCEVDIGFGYKITGHAKRTLDTVKDKAKWLRTLLVAVFKDEAGQYRYYKPRKNDGRLKKLPMSFMQLAESMYPALLDRLGYSAAAKQLEMKRLGAELADRATAIDRGAMAESSPTAAKRWKKEKEEEGDE